MMATDHSRLSKDKLIEAVIRMAASNWPFDVRSVAIQAVNDFNSLAAAPMDENAFEGAVVSMTGKLDVQMPAVPADLEAMTQAQLVTLAHALELAEWDYHRRTHMLAENFRFWTTKKAGGGSAPTAAQYLAMLLKLMNHVRAKRGLAAIS